MKRRRVFWVLMRRDRFNSSQADAVLQKLAMINEHVLPCPGIASFVAEDEDEGEECPRKAVSLA